MKNYLYFFFLTLMLDQIFLKDRLFRLYDVQTSDMCYSRNGNK